MHLSQGRVLDSGIFDALVALLAYPNDVVVWWSSKVLHYAIQNVRPGPGSAKNKGGGDQSSPPIITRFPSLITPTPCLPVQFAAEIAEAERNDVCTYAVTRNHHYSHRGWRPLGARVRLAVSRGLTS